MCTEINKEYSQRYWNLFDLLQQAYMDRYLLEEIVEYTEDIKQYEGAYKTRAYRVLGHISSLLKKDLCLIIWKVYCDGDNRANTIHKLNQFLMPITKKHYETKISKDLRPLETTLKTMRKQWLAHNDQEQKDLSLLTTDLYSMLDEICELLNGMMEKTVASDVVALDEGVKNALRTSSSIGLKAMIYRDGKPTVIVPKPTDVPFEQTEPDPSPA